MKSILAAFLILASATTAQARVATWKTLEKWTVVGDASEQWCTGYAVFNSGRQLNIARNSGGWNFGISGINVVSGDFYSAKIVTKYTTGTLIDGKALDNQSVAFAGLTDKMVANLAVAPAIYIEGLGIFDLTGSMRAVFEVSECFKAMSGVSL